MWSLFYLSLMQPIGIITFPQQLEVEIKFCTDVDLLA